MHLSSFTVGIISDLGSSGFFRTILIAPAGQWRAQLPQLTPSVFTTQLSRFTTACPIWIDDFSSLVIGRIAPAGQMSEHLVHSGRQYPLSYDISGCMRVMIDVDGLNTWLGHTLTQSWHAVQWSVKFFRLSDPAGTSGVCLSGFSARSMAVRPPSTFISCAFAATAVPAIADDTRNALRPWSADGRSGRP